MYSKLIILIFLMMLGNEVYAQDRIDCAGMLDQEPYFVKHKSGEKDLALKKDIEILKPDPFLLIYASQNKALDLTSLHKIA